MNTNEFIRTAPPGGENPSGEKEKSNGSEAGTVECHIRLKQKQNDWLVPNEKEDEPMEGTLDKVRVNTLSKQEEYI